MRSSIVSYIPAFSKKVSTVDTHKLILAPYPSTYLQLLLKHHLYYLHIYAHVLDHLLANTSKTKEQIVLIDYGAGNGLLGMFAKDCGFGGVYVNDRSEAFVDAALQLSTALNIPIDGFIIGEWDKVAEVFKQGIKPDAVVATDVIEHIYDLEAFLAGIQGLNPKMTTVFTTASVTANPVKTKQLKRLQYNDEFYGSNPEHAMAGDEFAGMPFIEIRKKMILQNQPTMNEADLIRIASAARGMNKKDLIKAVEDFTITGILPTPLQHPTNTCEPVTGSWTERLLTPSEYEMVYDKHGFSLSVYNGFYNQWQGRLKSIVLSAVNKLIKLSGRKGAFITPFMTLVGRKK
jgi:hypothetical protein